MLKWPLFFRMGVLLRNPHEHKGSNQEEKAQENRCVSHAARELSDQSVEKGSNNDSDFLRNIVKAKVGSRVFCSRHKL